jgi:phage tail protein X
MRFRRAGLTWLGLVTAVITANPGLARAQPWLSFSTHGAEKLEQLRAAAQVPLQQLPAVAQGNVKLVIDRPTLFATAPAEVFPCRPSQYYWFLDHPDRVMVAWMRLGAKCLPITDRGGGRFGWSDEQGSDLVWQTVFHDARLRIWYAEGNVRPAPLLPLVPIRAVVLLHHIESKDEVGGAIMNHQAEVFLQTDSKAATVIMRMLGSSVPRMAQEGVSQLQLFFAGISWYLERHPERSAWLLLGQLPPEPEQLPWPPSGP